jgi:hypothetical protein
MDAVIIIGFAYDKLNISKDREYLPGIIIDMYHAYKYVESISHIPNILVISDIYKDVGVSEIKSTITDSIVDMEIFNFIKNLRLRNQLINYTNKHQVITEIKKILVNKKRILFYYTGHSSSGNILLPLGNGEICYRYDRYVDTIISFIQIRDLISESTSKSAEIFIILDCCNANGLELPYKLVNSVYRLNYKNNKVYPIQKFICFSASNSDENSLASKNGSLFSYTLFKILKEHRNISTLLNLLITECAKKYDQTPNVYGSYPDIKMIWRWISNPMDTSVKINLIDNYFTIK